MSLLLWYQAPIFDFLLPNVPFRAAIDDAIDAIFGSASKAIPTVPRTMSIQVSVSPSSDCVIVATTTRLHILHLSVIN